MNLIQWPYYRTEFLASQGLSPTFVCRFWSKVNITDGCWMWLASTTRHGGYGQISGHARVGNCRPVRAHVASWILHNGPVPEDMCVLHKCDNPPCVRPDHLFLGTQQENMMDMNSKGRHWLVRQHDRKS